VAEILVDDGGAIVRRRLRVRGVVQGVGFRPYVYRLAQQFQLAGFVRNTSSGAVIEIEGAIAAAASFLEMLPQQGPPLMRIASMQTTNLAPLGEECFAIRESEVEASASADVPPDVSVCDACIADTCDPADRRFEYPFTNCTNCGPRYSIILDLPYDRAQTTMAGFTMCINAGRSMTIPKIAGFMLSRTPALFADHTYG
jgi:hydrogenase maturation protein HypF